MAKERPATPMLEAFLRQLRPPAGAVRTEKWDWPLAAIAFLAVAAIPPHNMSFIFGAAAACLVIFGLRTLRRQQLEQQDSTFRFAYRRWSRADHFRKLLSDGHLFRSVPQPVLLSLEEAARCWHDAAENLSGLALTEPTFAAEIQEVIDSAMISALAAAEPVAKRDNQTNKDIRRMESDTDLMNRICSRVLKERKRIEKWTPGPDLLHPDTPDELRTRLALARKERADAEAELDALI